MLRHTFQRKGYLSCLPCQQKQKNSFTGSAICCSQPWVYGCPLPESYRSAIQPYSCSAFTGFGTRSPCISGVTPYSQQKTRGARSLAMLPLPQVWGSPGSSFLSLVQRGSADASRQPAVRGLDGLAARKAEVIHPYFSRRNTHSCSLGKGPCSKNPPSSNASVINRIACADSACRTICFPFKI